MKKYLVNYCAGGKKGGGNFWDKRQKNMNEVSLKYGNIDGVFSWSKNDLIQTDFYKENKSILDQPRGAGYWAWKSFIIFDSLSRIDEGDFIIYYDVGGKQLGSFEINVDVDPIIEWTLQNSNGILPGFYRPDTLNKHYTKKDCFFYMGCDKEKYWNHPQIGATWSIWQKNDLSMEIISEYMEYSQDSRVITDSLNQSGGENNTGFIDHRHDQSILTNLAIKYGLRCHPITISSGKDINFFIRLVELDNYCLSNFGFDSIELFTDGDGLELNIRKIENKYEELMTKFKLLIEPSTAFQSTGKVMHTLFDNDGNYEKYDEYNLEDFISL